MRLRLLRRWRSVSFTVRFAVVLSLMGIMVASVPLLVIAQQGRAVALAHVTAQAQLLNSLVQDQQSAITAYARDIATQLDHADVSGSVDTLHTTLIRDSAAATQGDALGVVGNDNIVVLDGVVLGSGDPLVSAIAAGVTARATVVADAIGRPWLVGSAPMSHGDTVVTSRRLRGDIIPELIVLRNGHVASAGQLGGAAIGQGAAVDDSLVAAVTPPGRAGVITVSGQPVALASVELGNGFIAVTSSAAAAAGNIDPTTLLLVALSLVALLLTVVVVQADLHQPLRRLARAAAALADGDFSVPIPDNLGDDAVGRLARTFETTRRRLNITLRASRARAGVASELNTPQPLRAALHRVCSIVRDAAGAEDALIVVATSEIGESFAVSARAGPAGDAAAMLASNDPIGEAFRRHPGDVVEVGPTQRDGESITVECIAAVPIGMGSTALGVVAVTGADTELLRESIDMLTATADQLALALERYRILSVIQRQASTDDLTGLHNHRFLVDYLGQQIAVAERHSDPLTVLMLDLDHFKKINDTYGHHAGDVALREFAATVTKTIRRSDLAARYGGEEFVVVMPDTTAQQAGVVAEKIRAAVADMAVDIGSGHAAIHFTVSIGVASYPKNTLTGADLINLADEALYAAKGLGRDRVVFSETVALAANVRRHAPRKKKEPSPDGEGSPQR